MRCVLFCFVLLGDSVDVLVVGPGEHPVEKDAVRVQYSGLLFLLMKISILFRGRSSGNVSI
jgi:hypothetical protein